MNICKTQNELISSFYLKKLNLLQVVLEYSKNKIICLKRERERENIKKCKK